MVLSLPIVGVADKFHASLLQVLPAGKDHVLGQLEIGDAVDQQATRLGLGIQRWSPGSPSVPVARRKPDRPDRRRRWRPSCRWAPGGDADTNDLALIIDGKGFERAGQHGGVAFAARRMNPGRAARAGRPGRRFQAASWSGGKAPPLRETGPARSATWLRGCRCGWGRPARKAAGSGQCTQREASSMARSGPGK